MIYTIFEENITIRYEYIQDNNQIKNKNFFSLIAIMIRNDKFKGNLTQNKPNDDTK